MNGAFPRLVLLLAAAPLGAQAVPDARIRSGELAFEAKATLGAFRGVTSTVRGHLTGAATLAGVTGLVEAPAASLVTGNGTRDKDMRKSLEVERHPDLRFALDAIDELRPEGDSTRVVLVGTLTIHGVSRAVRLPAVIRHEAPDWRVRSRFELSMKDYGIQGLSKMLGMLKANERITVSIDLRFTPNTAPSAPGATP